MKTLNAHISRRERKLISQAESHPVAWQIREIARLYGRVELRPMDLLKYINCHVNGETRSSNEWPKSPNQLGRQLHHLRVALATKGVEVSFRRNGQKGRLWLIERVDLAEIRRHNEAELPDLIAWDKARERGEKAYYRALLKRIRADNARSVRKTYH